MSAAQVPKDFPGRITLPAGYVFQRPGCIDSYCGSFAKKDAPTVEIDIGEMAGVYTNDPDSTKGTVSRRTVGLPGQTAVVLIVKVSHEEQSRIRGKYAGFDAALKKVLISFPESKANFYSFVHTQQEIDVVEKIALSYVPESLIKTDPVGSILSPYLKR